MEKNKREVEVTVIDPRGLTLEDNTYVPKGEDCKLDEDVAKKLKTKKIVENKKDV